MSAVAALLVDARASGGGGGAPPTTPQAMGGDASQLAESLVLTHGLRCQRYKQLSAVQVLDALQAFADTALSSSAAAAAATAAASAAPASTSAARVAFVYLGGVMAPAQRDIVYHACASRRLVTADREGVPLQKLFTALRKPLADGISSSSSSYSGGGTTTVYVCACVTLDPVSQSAHPSPLRPATASRWALVPALPPQSVWLQVVPAGSAVPDEADVDPTSSQISSGTMGARESELLGVLHAALHAALEARPPVRTVLELVLRTTRLVAERSRGRARLHTVSTLESDAPWSTSLSAPSSPAIDRARLLLADASPGVVRAASVLGSAVAATAGAVAGVGLVERPAPPRPSASPPRAPGAGAGVAVQAAATAGGSPGATRGAARVSAGAVVSPDASAAGRAAGASVPASPLASPAAQGTPGGSPGRDRVGLRRVEAAMARAPAFVVIVSRSAMTGTERYMCSDALAEIESFMDANYAAGFVMSSLSLIEGRIAVVMREAMDAAEECYRVTAEARIDHVIEDMWRAGWREIVAAVHNGKAGADGVWIFVFRKECVEASFRLAKDVDSLQTYCKARCTPESNWLVTALTWSPAGWFVAVAEHTEAREQRMCVAARWRDVDELLEQYYMHELHITHVAYSRREALWVLVARAGPPVSESVNALVSLPRAVQRLEANWAEGRRTVVFMAGAPDPPRE